MYFVIGSSGLRNWFKWGIAVNHIAIFGLFIRLLSKIIN